MSEGRQRILAAAAELFAERGYAETSLRDIAAAVEIKAGSVYYHFASKDDLFVEVLNTGIDLMIEGFEKTASGAVNEPAERLRSHVLAHLRVLHASFAFTSLHVTAFRTAPAIVRDAVVPRRDAYEAEWTRLLADLLPETDPADLGILRLALFGAMNSSIDWFDAGRGNLEEFADLVTDVFWNGARARQRRATP